MKIYTNTFDLRQPTEKKFWVAPYSDFKIGIKVIDKNGDEVVADGSYTKIELYKDGKKLTIDSTEDSMLLYKIKSEDTGTVEYTVKVAIPKKVGCGSEGYINGEFTLTQVVTDSTVYEQESGGEIPSDLGVDSINANSANFGELFVPNANFSASGAGGYAMTTIGPVTINGCTGEGKFSTIRTNETYIGCNYINIQSNNGASLSLRGGCGATAYLEIQETNIIQIKADPNINDGYLVFKPYFMQELNGGCGGYVLASI